jgi:3-deoxy-D-manno-octulosonic-acid transferase
VSLLYNFFLLLYRTAITITGLWNKKARDWQKGRRGQWQRLATALASGRPRKRIWMHCASLGEFEQGRPVLEALRTQQPDAFIVLTFFSPSGYQVRHNWDGADYICYLPMDGPAASKRFLKTVNPSIAFFVKYEFWHYYLKELHSRHIPTILVSGAFRKSQPFFRPWGGFFRRMLNCFNVLTVQDLKSQTLLQGIGLTSKVHLTGDTRYDRVAQIAAAAKDLPLIETFRGSAKLIIAGSTWPDDERMLRETLPHIPLDWKLIIAPHEVHEAHILSIKSLFGDAAARYSSFAPGSDARVLIIDNIGMLSSLYRYGEIACIGGGYSRSGIHNVLEPAVFGLPVIMGPEYQKFSEAVTMVKKGFAHPAADADTFRRILTDLIQDDEGRHALQALIRTHIYDHVGATAKILALLPQLA